MFSCYFKKARRLGHPLGLNNAGLIFRGADLKEKNGNPLWGAA